MESFTVIPLIGAQPILTDSLCRDSFGAARSVAIDLADTGDYSEVQVLKDLIDETGELVSTKLVEILKVGV